MADYEVSISESLTLNDAPSEAAEFAEMVAESLTLNDGPSEAAEFVEMVAESLTLNDTPSEAAEFTETIAESLTLNDGPKGYMTMTPNEAAGRYRLADDDLERYDLYRGIDAEPDFDAAPWETFSSLPHTTAAEIMNGLGIDLRADCLLQYKFNDDDAESQIDDTSGNNNHGTLREGGPPGATEDHSVEGKVNNAIHFDGTDDYIDLASQVSLSGLWSITIGVYLNEDTNKPCVIFGKGHATQSYLWVSSNEGAVTVNFTNDAGASATWTTAGDGLPTFYRTWRNLTLISAAGGTVLMLFVNNVWKGNKSVNTDFNIAKISDDTPVPGYRFIGRLDILNIFDAQIPEADRNFLYNGGDWTEELVEYAAEYKFTLRKRNKYDLVSQNIESWEIELDEAGDVVEPLPDAPQNVQIAAAAGGKATVTAQYFYDLEDNYAATDWLVYFTDDGDDPDPATDEPTIVTMVKGRGMAHLSWLSDAADDEDTLKVLVRTRRTDGEDIYDSANTDIYSTTASTQGPGGQGGRAFTGGAAETL